MFRSRIFKFLKIHYNDIKQKGLLSLFIKTYHLLQYLLLLVSILLSFPIVLIIKLINPFITLRFGKLISSRIGHFSANTELYLCEKDENINIPINHKCIDIFFLGYEPICNQQLLKMWKRKIIILPKILIEPLFIANKFFPNKIKNEVPENSQDDRDIYHLMQKHSPHLSFTEDEENYGLQMLSQIGLKNNDKFVCLIVRDSAYLDKILTKGNWSYHNYRDCNIDNYILATEYLVKLGYYVIRMGAVVNKSFNINNPKVLDYATNGMRSDFMDIYLATKCEFCITSSLGWDSLPEIFNKPIVYTNIMPFGYLRTSSNKCINLSKHFIDSRTKCEISLSEIFKRGVGFAVHTNEYEKNGIELVENTAEEILDVTIEMVGFINSNFELNDSQKELQTKFWKIFPVNSKDINNNRPLHGEIKSIYSNSFLKNNLNWLN